MDPQPSWDWSAATGNDASQSAPMPDHSSAETASRPYSDARVDAEAPAQEQTTESLPAEPQPDPKRRRYGPRSCRICLDTEQPTFPENTFTTFGIRSASSRPEYVSDDPDLGRLLSPCKCKGSQKYVHEGCLNAWRLANPTAERNYWQCPTCGFTYRMVRLHWASVLSSKIALLALTLVVVVVGIFILGFIADPILDLWLDPVGTISDTVTSVVTDIEALEEPSYEPTTWAEHFVKGFFSLGLVGFFKSMAAISPLHFWNLRAMGTGGRRQGTGRARVENMNFAYVILGAFTFLMAAWKVVKSLSARVLKRVRESVLDVGEDDDDDDEVEELDADNGSKKDE